MPNDPNATPQVGSEPGGGAKADTQEPAGTPTYLGTYATKEDAEKGLENLRKEKDRLAGELGFFKAQAEKDQKLATVLEKLGTQTPKPDSKEQSLDWGAVKKAVEDGDADVVVGLFQDILASTAARDDVSKVEQTVATRIAALEAQLQEVRPEYLEHRETVAELQKQFPDADSKLLVQFATMLDAAKPVAPPADDPIAMVQSSRVTEPANAPKYTDAALAKLSRVIPGGLRESELKKLQGGQ
jgi:hypothetical protein